NRPDNSRDTDQHQCDPKHQKPPPILDDFARNLDVESLNVPHYHGLAPLRDRSVAARLFLLGFVGSMMSINGIENDHPRGRPLRTASERAVDSILRIDQQESVASRSSRRREYVSGAADKTAPAPCTTSLFLRPRTLSTESAT